MVQTHPDGAAVADADGESRESPSRADNEQRAAGPFATTEAARAETLLRITAAIADAVSDTEVFSALVDQLADTLGASSAGLWIVDDAFSGARMTRCRGYTEAAQRFLAVLPFDGGPSPALDVIRTGEALWFPSQPSLYARYPHLEPFERVPRSYRAACLPLVANGRTLGVLAVTIEEAGEARAEEREFLFLVARYASQALERLRLLEAERSSRAEAEAAANRLRVLGRVSTAFAESNLALESRLRDVVTEIGTTFGGAAAIFLVKDDGLVHTSAIHHDVPEAQEALLRLNASPFPVGTRMTGQVIASGKSLLVRNADPQALGERIDPAYRAFFARFPVYAMIYAPLRARGRVIGSVSAARTKSGETYDRSDLHLLEELAERAASALENSRLYEETLAAQAKAERSLAQLETVVNNMSDGLVVSDADGALVVCNPAALRIDGYRDIDEVRQHVREHPDAYAVYDLDGRELGVAEWPLARARRGEEFSDLEVRILRKDIGREWIASYGGGQVRDRDGAILWTILTLRDVTKQKELENELRRRMTELAQADRRKDEFLATLAHELRNPLAPIRNAVEILKLTAPPDPKLTGTFDVIDRQVRHMARMLEDLLDVSRISRDKLELRREAMAIQEAVETAVETSRPILDAGQHELRVNAPQEPIWVDGDLVRLAQIFSNLLNNAAKYTSSGGKILVSVEGKSNRVTVSVKDNGIGIEPEMLSKIFDIFTQAGAAVGRSQGGIGIGLSLVKGLVMLHGGTITAKSDGMDRGSEFIVELPTIRIVGLEPDKPAVLAPDQRAYRVLVVDDNVDNAQTIAKVLELLGNEVQTALDGPTALRIAEVFAPNVVLLDLGMPGMDGFEVCRGLRAHPRLRGIFIVAMTGWGGDENRLRTRDAGFDAHLVKPVDIAVLMNLLTDRVRPE